MMIRPVLVTLVASAVLLPVATMVLFGAGRLLGAMQDTAGQAVLIRVSQASGIAWVLVLIVLLIGLALDALARSDQSGKNG